MNKKETRLNNIIHFLKIRNSITVKEMANHLNVSEMTVRRDIKELTADHTINFENGKIMFNPQSSLSEASPSYSLESEKEKRNLQKELIGKFAATLVEPNDTVIIDSGSTTEHLAHYIPGGMPITALCYSMNILNELITKEDISLIFPGGFYHPNAQMFESQQGIELINQIRANKVFLSAAGIHRELGITCMHNYEISTMQAVIKSSVTKILLADSSKFDQIRPAYFASLECIDIIVTDHYLAEEWQEYIRGVGIELYLV
ncbi:DeoR family transcriptional regulator [Hungatella effluvii]|uniref:DeoR family transcriptional regulator n=1 Tax=Hungatella effluvii TaxID=1096246 RepID=A0A2V3Y6R7_9FIRM|nr:DeoR/GlpR family DNA-binding transcription regulator [Hungatella effluvii]PXX53685.1 DeoR family transcriptional regulator [Hungatella effluvii]